MGNEERPLPLNEEVRMSCYLPIPTAITTALSVR